MKQTQENNENDTIYTCILKKTKCKNNKNEKWMAKKWRQKILKLTKDNVMD
jgi:hypothetical protein